EGDGGFGRQDPGEMEPRLDPAEPGALVGSAGAKIARRRPDRERGLAVRQAEGLRRIGEGLRSEIGGAVFGAKVTLFEVAGEGEVKEAVLPVTPGFLGQCPRRHGQQRKSSQCNGLQDSVSLESQKKAPPGRRPRA